MAFSIAIAAGVATKDMRTVTVSYDGKLYEVTTRADNVAGALKDAGIVLATEDKVNYDLTCSIDGISGIIEVEKPITLTVNMAGQEKVITTYTKDVDKVLEENDIEVDEEDIVEGAADDGTVSDGDEINVVIVSTDTVTEKEEIPS